MRNFISFIFVASLLITAPLSFDLNAQAGTQKNQNDNMKQKYRKARVLQTSTAKKITKVVEALERVNEEGKEDPDWVTVRVILNELLTNKDELKSYDRSVMWNSWAYVYFDEQNYEYLKMNYPLKKELVADSRYKIIRGNHINKKFYKPIGFFLIVATLFFLFLQMGIITPMTLMP